MEIIQLDCGFDFDKALQIPIRQAQLTPILSLTVECFYFVFEDTLGAPMPRTRQLKLEYVGKATGRHTCWHTLQDRSYG
jgi:hypothetical protein